MSDNWIISNLETAIDTWNDRLNDVSAILTQSPESFRGGGVWSIILNIHDVLKATGFSLLVLFFFVGVLESCTSFEELRRPERALKLFIRFAVAKGIVSYGMDLMLGIVRIGQGIVKTVFSSYGSTGAMSSGVPLSIKEGIENCSLIESIPLWAVTLLACVVIWALSFILVLTVYTRFFKIYMFAAIAPVPLATFASEKCSTIGKSFLKGFLAVSLEGVVILLCCVIFSALSSTPPIVDSSADVLTQIWTYVGELIFNMLILVSTVKASDRIVKEMLSL